ncbi:hypothetical protein BJV74DRAFT_990304 [Russula compacta]|nr:hypothetical protein BJV74DRAFT_990304 [Russula compacta]
MYGIEAKDDCEKTAAYPFSQPSSYSRHFTFSYPTRCCYVKPACLSENRHNINTEKERNHLNLIPTTTFGKRISYPKIYITTFLKGRPSLGQGLDMEMPNRGVVESSTLATGWSLPDTQLLVPDYPTLTLNWGSESGGNDEANLQTTFGGEEAVDFSTGPSEVQLESSQSGGSGSRQVERRKSRRKEESGVCDLCNRSFSRLSDVKRHKKTAHEKEVTVSRPGIMDSDDEYARVQLASTSDEDLVSLGVIQNMKRRDSRETGMTGTFHSYGSPPQFAFALDSKEH